jgi:hypothetical protein
MKSATEAEGWKTVAAATRSMLQFLATVLNSGADVLIRTIAAPTWSTR